MERERPEDGLLTAEANVICEEDVVPSDWKATPVVVVSSIVALCASLSIGCSVSSTKFSKLAWSILLIVIFSSKTEERKRNSSNSVSSFAVLLVCSLDFHRPLNLELSKTWASLLLL
jgi:hypothetical protein